MSAHLGGNAKQPLYTIGIAAKLVGVCAATLRIWECKGIVCPNRIGKNRYYTDAEIQRLKYVKFLVRERKLNLEGVKALLDQHFCWDVKNCSIEDRHKCSVYIEHLRDIGADLPET